MFKAILRICSVCLLVYGLNPPALADPSACAQMAGAMPPETALPSLPLPSTSPLRDSSTVMQTPGARPAIFAACDGSVSDVVPFQTLVRFRRWLRVYGSPVVCDMIFCHSTCRDYDDSCPSFNHRLLPSIEGHDGCISKSNMDSSGDSIERSGANDLSARMSSKNADLPGCCTEDAQMQETFSSAGSPIK